MPDITEDQKSKLDILVENQSQWFNRLHDEITFIARTQLILVLGDHPPEGMENVFTKVIDKLREKGHSVIRLRDVSKQGNHIYNQKLAMKLLDYSVVIKLDWSDSDNDKPPKAGSVGENVITSYEKDFQEKTFLFLKDTEENRKMVFDIEDYCLYFPRTYFCKDEDDMVEKAVKIAIREAYRITYLQHPNGLDGKTLKATER